MIGAAGRTLKSAAIHFWNSRLKFLRKLLVVFVLLLMLAAALLWFLPARWALPWIEPRLHGIQLQQVSGSVWNGRANAVVTADAQTLGRLQWQLSRRALLGHPRLQLNLDGPQLMLSSELERLPDDQTALRETSVRLDATAFGHRMSTPWGQPRGQWQVSIPHAMLRAGWPMDMEASATWRDAVMRTAGGDVALGELQSTVQASGGVVHAQLHDAGRGPLQLAGDLQFSPLGWRLDATLRARQPDPALQHWLATLGTPASDGSVHIQRHGGLAGSTPALPTH